MQRRLARPGRARVFFHVLPEQFDRPGALVGAPRFDRAAKKQVDGAGALVTFFAALQRSKARVFGRQFAAQTAFDIPTFEQTIELEAQLSGVAATHREQRAIGCARTAQRLFGRHLRQIERLQIDFAIQTLQIFRLARFIACARSRKLRQPQLLLARLTKRALFQLGRPGGQRRFGRLNRRFTIGPQLFGASARKQNPAGRQRLPQQQTDERQNRQARTDAFAPANIERVGNRFI